MIRIGLGVLLAAVAMFMWGFLYWAVLANPFTPLTAEGETAIAQALQAHVKSRGLYMVPSPGLRTMDEMAEPARKGPFAIMHAAPAGVPFGDATVMISGFVHMFISAALLAVVLMVTAQSGPDFMSRMRIVVAVALVGTVFINFAQPIWWHHDWSVTFVYAAYDLIALLLAGAILSFFVGRS